MLKKAEPKRLAWFEKVQEKYAHSLEWCLQHRALPLIAAVVLLVFSGWQVLNMGVELLPSITSNEAQITLSTADGLTKEESYAIAGQVAEAALNVENVEEVGITLDTSMAGLDISQLGLPTAITDILNSANAYGRYKINVMMSKSLSSREVEKTRQAMEDAGFQLKLPEEFESGFRFQQVRTGEVECDDDDGNHVLTYMDVSVDYENDQGQQLGFYAIPNLGDAVEEDTHTPVISKTVGDITLNYFVDHYKFVPEDYELSEADKEWMQQPGNYLSYGADSVVEETFASLSWATDEGKFSFMDMTASINPDVLFAMAEEIIK